MRLNQARIEKVHHHPFFGRVARSYVQQVRRLTIRAKCGWRFTVEVTLHRWRTEYLPVLCLLWQQCMTPPATFTNEHRLALTCMRDILILGRTHYISRRPAL